MARTNLKTVSTYMTEEQLRQITRAADLDNRSVSNFLLTLGLQRAVELGIPVMGIRHTEDKRAHAIGGSKR